MVITDTGWDVASWMYEKPDRSWQPPEWEGTEKRLRNLQMCADILAKYQLLDKSQIIFDGQWEYKAQGVTDLTYYTRRSQDPTLSEKCFDTLLLGYRTKVLYTVTPECTLHWQNTSNVYDVSMAYILSQQEVSRQFKDPFKISLDQGNTLLYTSQIDSIWMPNIIKVHVTSANDFGISIYTDAFLEYSLDGKDDRSAYHHLNADRLEKALFEIGEALGYHGYEDGCTDYCDVKGYRVFNFRDDDGAILPLDAGGHCLPSEPEDE